MTGGRISNDKIGEARLCDKISPYVNKKQSNVVTTNWKRGLWDFIPFPVLDIHFSPDVEEIDHCDLLLQIYRDTNSIFVYRFSFFFFKCRIEKYNCKTSKIS